MSYYSQEFEIMSHDVDSNNIVRPSVITRILQETANHHMRDRKPTYYELFREGKSYVLVRFTCEIKKELYPYDKVTVKTWTCEGKAATFKRCYVAEVNGEEAVRAYSEWAVVDINTKRLLKVSEVDSSNYEMDEELDMILPSKFRFPKNMEFIPCGSHQVKHCDCDMNLHMNNTNYPDMIWNEIPDNIKKRATGFSFRFMAEAPRGETIEIRRGQPEEIIDDGSSPEETWCFMTEVKGRTNLEGIINCKAAVGQF